MVPQSVPLCPARRREVQLEAKRWQVDAAVLRLHSRRCTCLEFHPLKDNLVLSGAPVLCAGNCQALPRPAHAWSSTP